MPDKKYPYRKAQTGGGSSPGLHIRVPQPVKEAVLETAEKQHRSVSNLCFRYIEQGLQRDLENGGA